MDSTVFQILGLIWAVFLLSTGPLNAFLARRSVTKRAPQQREGYASAARGLGILGVATVIIDVLGDRKGVAVLLTLPPPPSLIAWSILTSIVCLGISIGFLLVRRMLARPLPSSIVTMLPQARSDLPGWICISIIAGVSEEYVFRGFCLILLVSTVNSPLVAFALVTSAFGIGHGYQDLLGIVRASLAGAVLAIPVLVLGALIPSIIAHVVIDVFAGLSAHFSLLKRWKLVPAPEFV